MSKEKKTEPQQADDLDLSKYRETAAEHPQLDDLSQLSSEDQKVLLMSGVDPSGKERVGSFFQKDHTVVHCRTAFDGAEIMSFGGRRLHRTRMSIQSERRSTRSTGTISAL